MNKLFEELLEQALLNMFDVREDFNSDNMYLKQSVVEIDNNTFYISTIDCGINLNILGEKPLYFETMIFPKAKADEYNRSVYQARYSTKEEALIDHVEIAVKIKNGDYRIDERGNLEF